MARSIVAIVLLLTLPGILAAQADTNDIALRVRFAPVQLDLRTPVALRSPGYGGPRISPAQAVAAWDSSVARGLDSTRVLSAVQDRLRAIYGIRSYGTLAEGDTVRERRGVFGLNRKYADLAIDGQARLEIRTERLRNERCTPFQLIDINSGCRGGFKAPRFDNELNMIAGGIIGQRLHLNIDFDTQRDFAAKNNIQVYYQGLEDEVVRRVEVGTVAFRPPPTRFITAAIPANNFGVAAAFQFGALQLQTIAATQKGSVVAERTYTIGETTTQPQDRQQRDLDFETGRFFWVIDPSTIPGYPALDILNLNQGLVPPAQQPVQVRIYRYRPAAAHSGVNPNLGGITAIAIGADTSQRANAQWELLLQGQDYYADPSGLWFALSGKLDVNDFLAVSYTTVTGRVGTLPTRDRPPPPGSPPLDTLRLISQPNVSQALPTFRHEIRNVYRIAGSDLDRNSLKVTLTVNRSEVSAQGPTYLALLGLAIPTNTSAVDVDNRVFPRIRDPGAGTTIHESYLVFPNLQPFADPTKLTPAERSDSLYRTPLYLLLTEGPPAKFIMRLQYNATGTGDRSTLNLNALQIRDGSEQLVVGGRVLQRGVDYNISYDVGQVTFLDPNGLFGQSGSTTVSARFEERGLFAIAPTSIFGIASRYSLGERGGINLIGMYQAEQTAFNRPPLGFEASANLVGGISTDLHFRPNVLTRLFNKLTAAPTTVPSRFDINGEVALTHPDPNRSGQAYLEEFEGDAGIPVSLREGGWGYGSKPQSSAGVDNVVGAQFDSADAVQLIWQNLIDDGSNTGRAVELRARDIDPLIQVAGSQDQIETVMYMTLHADTAGGIVQRNRSSRWSMPAHPNAPRWRSIVTPLSSNGTDLSKNEYLEFWVFQGVQIPGRTSRADSAGVQIVVDLGSVNEDALALAPDSLTVVGPDTLYKGRQYVGVGRLNSEREPVTGVFNADVDDIGILGDRPDTLFTSNGVLEQFPLCREQLSNAVPVFPWGDLSSRCSNGNGLLDTEDLNGDLVLNGGGANDNVFRWVVDLNNPKYFVRDGVTTTGSIAGWKLYRIPLRTPDFQVGSPNIRLIQHLRVTVVAPAVPAGPDPVAQFALARMRFLGSPWVRRSDRPVASLAGATSQPLGEVISSTISTENAELNYQSPPGIVAGTGTKGGTQSDLGTQINEKSLRLIGSSMAIGDRAEAYLRFPAGPQNLLRYGEVRFWARGSGLGWEEGDFKAYLRLGSDNRNFYQYLTNAHSGTTATAWEPEYAVSLDIWRQLRAQVEVRYLQGLPADSVARVACGGDTVSTAFVACSGPYLVYVSDPGINPPNLAAAQELSAGILRVAANTPAADAEVWIDDVRLTQPISKVGMAMAFDARVAASDVADLSLSYVRQDGYFQQIGDNPTYRTTGAMQLSSSWRLDRFLPTSLGLSMPASVALTRSQVDPVLVTGSDLRASDLAGLRKPESWSATYSVALRRTQRGKSWLVRGFLDPLGLLGTWTNGNNQTELSHSTASAYSYQANYSLVLGRGGLPFGLGGLVDKLPGFLRRSEAAKGLRRPVLNLVPSNLRWSSGLSRSQAELLSFQVPVARPQDTLIQPISSLQYLWRNTAGLSWQPLGMLTLGADLASTRDLRDYSDTTTLARVAQQSRKSLAGLDVGVERDRNLSTTLALTPRITSWLRPRFITGSNFLLSRSLTSRAPIRLDGDSGAFILPQTLNNGRNRELGASVDLSRLLGQIFGDSSLLGRSTRRLRPLDVANRSSRTSIFDLAAFTPDLGYQLALGGLDQFLTHQGETALGATDIKTTTFSSGADLPLGISATISYSRLRTSVIQRVGTTYIETEALQREWPVGSVRWTRTLRHGPFALIGVGTTFRRRSGVSTQPAFGGNIRSATSSSSLAPDLQLGFRNGLSAALGYSKSRQATENHGNATYNRQDDINASLNYAFRLPASVSRLRKTLRTSLTGLLSTGISCLQQPGSPTCDTISDIRRQEVRGGVDTDILKIMTGGLQFGYSVNDARSLDTKTSQLFVSMTFQLSLFAGDYR
ncbi:MAG: cell surface protein SprA [Gemmatimonadota bacterium]